MPPPASPPPASPSLARSFRALPLLLVRHARAEEDHPLGDAVRGLTRQGREAFRLQAHRLASEVGGGDARVGHAPGMREVAGLLLGLHPRALRLEEGAALALALDDADAPFRWNAAPGQTLARAPAELDRSLTDVDVRAASRTARDARPPRDVRARARP